MLYRKDIRLAGFDYAQAGAYYVTICCNDRKKVFSDSIMANLAWNVLKDRFQKNGGEITTAVLLHDHLHLIIEIGEHGVDTLGDRVRTLKIAMRTTLFQNEWKGTRLWQRGFYDHIIRNEHDWLEKANYMRNNPIRAGLVDDIENWPFWWAIGMD